jgi:hypothetical protein
MGLTQMTRRREKKKKTQVEPRSGRAWRLLTSQRSMTLQIYQKRYQSNVKMRSRRK